MNEERNAILDDFNAFDALQLTEYNIEKFKKRHKKAIETQHDRFRWNMKNDYNDNKCSVSFAHYIIEYWDVMPK
jgi:hypothetical protein